MKILDRYIGRTVLSATLLALAVLVALSAFFTFVGEVGDIGIGDYRLPQVLEYVVLVIPAITYELFPMAALLGSLMGLGVLAANSELVVVRAAGVSLGRIVRSVLQIGLALMLVAVLVGEFVAPASTQYAENRRAIAQTQRITLKTRYGLWVRDGSTFINVRRVLSDSRISGIYIYEFDGRHRLRTATHAWEAHYTGEKWRLVDIRQTVFEAERTVSRNLAEAAWESLLSPDLLSIIVVRPENLSAVGLYRYIDYLRANGLDARRYELALWIKVVAPFSTLVMMFLGVPFVFGPLRSVGAGQRIFVGIMVGIGFFLLNRALNHVGLVYGLNPLLSAVLPTVLFLGLGIWGVRRVR